MGRSFIGVGLFYLGVAMIGSVFLDVIGGTTGDVAPFFPAINILLVLLGVGVLADEIRFEQETAWKYQGLVFLFDVVVTIGLVVRLFTILS